MYSRPPNGYVCRICNIPGHWIQQCPLKRTFAQRQTHIPYDYRCKICGKSDHFIYQCPLKYQPTVSNIPADYVCHICGIPGHWIQNCPEKSNHKYYNQIARYEPARPEYTTKQFPTERVEPNPSKFTHDTIIYCDRYDATLDPTQSGVFVHNINNESNKLVTTWEKWEYYPHLLLAHFYVQALTIVNVKLC